MGFRRFTRPSIDPMIRMLIVGYVFAIRSEHKGNKPGIVKRRVWFRPRRTIPVTSNLPLLDPVTSASHVAMHNGRGRRNIGGSDA